MAYDAQNSLEYTGGVLTASHDEKSFTISDEKEITYNDPNRSLAISPEGMSLAEDGKSVSLSPEEMEIILSEDKKHRSGCATDQIERCRVRVYLIFLDYILQASSAQQSTLNSIESNRLRRLLTQRCSLGIAWPSGRCW